MSDYKAPLRDIRFTFYELLEYEAHYAALPGAEEASPDIVNAILDEAGKFCEEVLAPLNSTGDREGCQWNDGEVSTPSGFKEAYQQYVDAGWPSMTHSTQYGGQGLPQSLGTVLSEMKGAANWSWAMYPGLSHGCMNTLDSHGTDEQKSTYLPSLIAGNWTGTMCLTEAHCGTDLGMLRTKAEPNDDGSYTITGTKIFISAGEHDLSDNIIHIVLARLPDAPEGTKGISLFIVPKFLVNDAGECTERNGVNCGSLEHKMGIHGNATCVLNFEKAKGFLIGPPNHGLACMFTFMNSARIGTAIQGLAHSELGYQKSLAYAQERLQMRSLSGVKNPDAEADPIIVHPDVRRMLLTQKALSEGARMLIYYAAQQMDLANHAEDEKTRETADELLGLLTPIAKAFITEVGFESANLGLQCFGGHGYIQEWGMEQNVRDARIAMLYEGTTGIQALDLLGRKVLKTRGDTLKLFGKVIQEFAKSCENRKMKEFNKPLLASSKQLGDITMKIGMSAMRNKDAIGAASVDYLMFSGYVTLAYLWARAANVAYTAIDAGTSEKAFYEAKIKTARFYYERILPRTLTLAATIESGHDNLMSLESEAFSFE